MRAGKTDGHENPKATGVKVTPEPSIRAKTGQMSHDISQMGGARRVKTENCFYLLNKGVLANFEKARVFAILEERDSMYYYINKEKNIYKIRYFNSYFEVDPYRKEERFKALLKKNYLPLTHWNE